jgi:hypothetical protein
MVSFSFTSSNTLFGGWRFLEELGRLFECNVGRLGIFRNTRVLFAVGDVGAVAAIEDFDFAAFKDFDIARSFLLGVFFYELERGVEFDSVRVVPFCRDVTAANFNVWSEAADIGKDVITVFIFAEVARQIKEHERFFEGDVVDGFAIAYTGKFWLFFVFDVTDLHHGAEAAEACGYRLTSFGVVTEDAGLGGFGTGDVGRFLDAGVERSVESLEHFLPGDFAVGYFVEFTLNVFGEVVVDDVAEVFGEKVSDDAARACGNEFVAVCGGCLESLDAGDIL